MAGRSRTLGDDAIGAWRCVEAFVTLDGCMRTLRRGLSLVMHSGRVQFMLLWHRKRLWNGQMLLSSVRLWNESTAARVLGPLTLEPLLLIGLGELSCAVRVFDGFLSGSIPVFLYGGQVVVYTCRLGDLEDLACCSR